MEKYLEPLPPNVTLRIFKNDQMIFESCGKWLHPLFDADKFFSESFSGVAPVGGASSGDSAAAGVSSSSSALENQLSSHDTAIGKAAAVLTVRLGVKKIHANLCSQLAKDYIDSCNQKLPENEKITLVYDNLIPRLMCATEDQLAEKWDSDEMYFLLRQRAKLVQGVDVSVQKVSCRYGVLKNISFELKSGGHLMIEGENGAGKTTLLRFLAGIAKPESGLILIDGKAPEKLEKFTIGYIPQTTDKVQFSLSVEEVIGLGIKDRKNKNQIIRHVLERTSSVNLAGRSYDTLSGGEKQKINLARCLAQNAKLLLLDEPTAALDSENRKMVMDILRSLTISEIPTIIVVTHDKELTEMRGWEVLKLGEADGFGTASGEAAPVCGEAEKSC